MTIPISYWSTDGVQVCTASGAARVLFGKSAETLDVVVAVNRDSDHRILEAVRSAPETREELINSLILRVDAKTTTQA